MVFDNNFIFRRWISSELCFSYFSNLVLNTTPKSNGNFFMDLTNIEGIERLECITVLTEVASKLSGNLHIFCTQLCKGEKKFGNVTGKNYLNESLLSLLCITFEKGLM